MAGRPSKYSTGSRNRGGAKLNLSGIFTPATSTLKESTGVDPIYQQKGFLGRLLDPSGASAIDAANIDYINNKIATQDKLNAALEEGRFRGDIDLSNKTKIADIERTNALAKIELERKNAEDLARLGHIFKVLGDKGLMHSPTVENAYRTESGAFAAPIANSSFRRNIAENEFAIDDSNQKRTRLGAIGDQLISTEGAKLQLEETTANTDRELYPANARLKQRGVELGNEGLSLANAGKQISNYDKNVTAGFLPVGGSLLDLNKGKIAYRGQVKPMVTSYGQMIQEGSPEINNLEKERELPDGSMQVDENDPVYQAWLKFMQR